MAGETTFQMNVADMTAASRDRFWGWLLSRKSLGTHLIIVAFFFAIGFIRPPGCGCGTLGERLYGGATLAGWLLAAAGALYVYSYLMQRQVNARLYRQQTSLHEPITIAWSDEALTATSKHGTLTYPWSDLESWSDRARSIAVKYGSYYYYLVPRRVLSDEAQADLVATLQRSGLKRN